MLPTERIKVEANGKVYEFDFSTLVSLATFQAFKKEELGLFEFHDDIRFMLQTFQIIKHHLVDKNDKPGVSLSRAQEVFAELISSNEFKEKAVRSTFEVVGEEITKPFLISMGVKLDTPSE